MKKIAIILSGAVILRMINIFSPVSGWHSWRQADTGSIARNFYENGFNILYPQINWGGSRTGFVESEFQIFPFLVSILYSVFGINDTWGRVVSLVCSVFTIFGLYLLVRKIINEETAIWSAVIYAILPLNIFYGRAFMPDSAMLMCSVYGIYFFYRWTENESIKYFILSGLFISLAALIKLPALYLGLPLIYLVYQKSGWKLFTDLRLYILAILIIAPVALWYYHAHQLFLNGGSSFGIWTYGQDKWGMFSLLTDPAWYNDIFFKSIAERHLTYPAFILFVWGLFIKRTFTNEKLFDVWLIAVLIFIFIAAQAHRAQEFYTLPFTIPASVFTGKFLAKYLPLFSRKFKEIYKANKLITSFAVICFLLTGVLSYLRVARFYSSESLSQPIFKIAAEVQSVTKPGDKIITIGDGNPVYLYHSHRFGWTAMPQQIDSLFIASRVKEGAKLIAGEKNVFIQNSSAGKIDFLLNNYKVIKNEPDYIIVGLE